MKNTEFKRSQQALKVSRFYYEHNYDQSKIAKLMGLSRPTVSRLLQFAKDSGFVQITIKDPFNDTVSLAKQIEDKYNIDKAIVTYVPTTDYKMVLEGLGKAGAEYLEGIVQDNDSIGITWGETMGYVARNLNSDSNTQENVRIIELKGSDSNSKVNNYSHEIVSDFANAFNTRIENLPLPVIFSNNETTKMVKKDDQIKKILNDGKETNIALYTVGTVRSDALLFNLGYLKDDEVEKLKRESVGDICSRFITSKGEIADDSVNDRTIAIELDELKNKKYSILIAGGEQKTNAIKAALTGGYSNVLVTDSITAQELLN